MLTFSPRAVRSFPIPFRSHHPSGNVTFAIPSASRLLQGLNFGCMVYVFLSEVECIIDCFASIAFLLLDLVTIRPWQIEID